MIYCCLMSIELYFNCIHVVVKQYINRTGKRTFYLATCHQASLQTHHLPFIYSGISIIHLLAKPSNEMKMKGTKYNICYVFSESLNLVIGQTVSVQL